MERHPEITRRRLQVFKAELEALIYAQHTPIPLLAYAAPDRIPYAQAVEGDYQPVKIGDQLAPSWSTHWFKLDIAIPAEWAGQEVHLLWDSSSEACVWRDGQPLRGLSGSTDSGERPAHLAFRLVDAAQAGETIRVYVEVAVNDYFGINRTGKYSRIGLLRQAEIAVFNRAAWELYWDYVIVADSAQQMAQPRSGQALFTANAMVNAIDVDDSSSWENAHAIAREFLALSNGDGQHFVSALGHAHIDTAWLWPLAETRRKCVRTFATVMELMDRYPEYRFVCSQAQQLAWIKEDQPELYERIKIRISEGRFIPAGGAWVEPDCNIPSGESLTRQFLYGQRFYQQEFGITCEEFWLPDTFGYPAALPAIMRGAGIRYFLTQKLSWNQFNKPTFSTFIWEGLDGSQVLAHFPPADTYNGMVTVEEVLRSIHNFKDHGRSRHSMYLFGYGDGGGGPNEAMLESLVRMHNVDGLPEVEQRSPGEFFKLVEAESERLTTWVGELYFELHRGTYTTQARNKLGNRRSEGLLHDVEFLWALKPEVYPSAELERLWKLVLLNQFHDILPGSSITQVYVDSAEQYADIRQSAELLRQAALGVLFPNASGGNVVAVNTLAWDRQEVVELPMEVETAQKAANGKALTAVHVPSMGYAVASPDEVLGSRVTLNENNQGFVLENAAVRAVIGRDGLLKSFFDKVTWREMMSAPGNQFVLFDDHPMHWEAWDVDVFHLEKRRDVSAATSAQVLENGPLRVAVQFSYDIGDGSTMQQTVSLTAIGRVLEFACEVDWHESSQFLKVEFPTTIRTAQAHYETQYGYVQRPTHFNTSWDVARFEVSAHRWGALLEHGSGFALLNDSKYGYAAHGNVLRLSLLRATHDPDPVADMGKHVFRYGVLACDGTMDSLVAEGQRFNTPLLLKATGAEQTEQSYFSVAPDSVVLDTVKKAEDSDAIILRLYEACGGHCTARIQTSLPFSAAMHCDSLENEEGALEISGNKIQVELAPFQVVTVKLIP